ncbi:MAG: permease [Negativicutes bacterium]|nr:permease [Negativicutes bacterium]MDR3590278.1 permease [Negativicutes bacterium]
MFDFDVFGNLVVYQWLGLSPQDRFGSALQFFVADTPKILLLLAAAIFIITVIRSYFPPAKTKKFLSRRHSIVGNILAALIGILTPFCSCSAVPLFIGFIEAGVPLGVTFSFLISSPMVNEIALIMLLGMFGWKVALLYASTGVVVAVISGYVIGRLKLEHLLEDYGAEAVSGEADQRDPTFRERCQAAGNFTVELLKYIAPYILVALAIGGFIHGFVPEDFVVTYAGRDNPLAVPLVVLLGVPLYNSSSGMVPIIYALMEKGLPLGTSLAFMMSVSAISFPEMIILRRVLKVRLIGIFAGILTVAIIITGYLFNMVV